MSKNADLAAIAKALSNEVRIELFSKILEGSFLSKGILSEYVGISHRASLDHHLRELEAAELIGISSIRLEGHRFVFVYPKVNLKISIQDKIELQIENREEPTLMTKITDDLSAADVANLSSELRSQELEGFVVDKLINGLMAALGTLRKGILCSQCRTGPPKPANRTCSSCGKPVCEDCIHEITKPDGGLQVICRHCRDDMAFR